jgi:cytidine deaminase
MRGSEDTMKIADLAEKAKRARLNAQAPYSGFKVGAALEALDGKIFTGCNVENASYGLTMCAERVAILKAVSEGAKGFRRILVLSDSEKPAPPCGACRQIIWEYCGDIDVILANLKGGREKYRMKQLLPLAFDKKCLKPFSPST